MVIRSAEECEIKLVNALLAPIRQVGARARRRLEAGDVVARVAAVVCDRLLAHEEHLLCGQVHARKGLLVMLCSGVLNGAFGMLAERDDQRTRENAVGIRLVLLYRGCGILPGQEVRHTAIQSGHRCLGDLEGGRVERIVFQRHQIGGQVHSLLLGEPQPRHLRIAGIVPRLQ